MIPAPTDDGPDPALIPDLDDGVPDDDAAEPEDADVAHLHPEPEEDSP